LLLGKLRIIERFKVCLLIFFVALFPVEGLKLRKSFFLEKSPISKVGTVQDRATQEDKDKPDWRNIHDMLKILKVCPL
jgi:hypothetical protein